MRRKTLANKPLEKKAFKTFVGDGEKYRLFMYSRVSKKKVKRQSI